MRFKLGALIAVAALPLCARAQIVSSDLPHYCQALRLYAGGRIEDAVAIVHAWPASELKNVMVHTSSCTGGGSTAAHATLLATDVAVAHRDGPVQRVADYLAMAFSMLGNVQPAHLGVTSRAAVAAFQEDWFVVASRLLLAWTDPEGAGNMIDRGLHSFRDSARLHTLAGMAAEMRTHLRFTNVHDRNFIEAAARGPWRMTLADAETEFRRALALNPADVEGRVHLGRVLYLSRKTQEARETLGPAAADAGAPPEMRYLAHLFLGACAEFEHDRDAARTEYEAALQTLPDVQTPYVALSFIEQISGHEARAREIMARWADTPMREHGDPWSAYQNGGFDDAFLAALRAKVVQ